MIHVISPSGAIVQHAAMDCAQRDFTLLMKVWRGTDRLEAETPTLKAGQPLVEGIGRCIACAYHYLAKED